MHYVTIKTIQTNSWVFFLFFFFQTKGLGCRYEAVFSHSMGEIIVWQEMLQNFSTCYNSDLRSAAVCCVCLLEKCLASNTRNVFGKVLKWGLLKRFIS